MIFTRQAFINNICIFSDVSERDNEEILVEHNTIGAYMRIEDIISNWNQRGLLPNILNLTWKYKLIKY